MSTHEETDGPEQYRPHVLVGVDGSEDGLRAVAFGVRAALARKAELLLVHAVDDAVLAGTWGVVYDPSSLESAASEVLAEAVKHAVDTGMAADQVHTEVVLGNAAAVLAKLSKDATLLVIGRRAISGLERMFVGSTSVSLASTAACPVVVISNAVNPGPTGAHGVVGIGVECDKHSTQTLKAAFDEARLRGASVLATTVQANIPPGMFGGYRLTAEAETEMRHAAELQLADIVGRVAGEYPDVPHTLQVTLGHPVEQLIALSATVDLLVLGMRPPSVIGFSIGGVTRAVLAHAKCPLLVVH
ncbi:universal stress protein [Aestuariimicrobium sp. T2.26MG-19.2B]|uniref:universal stress protein n=1 Tax=Aestuariimicrobium sp. T2.26MG-19.2B TaxID=3040679 RepID=UPI002477A968|nr:universal stress protein [Aestuariimicrobium sp. T2.26MG-19.2B]CAI9408592.1 Universal stress protein [Aestuariimicrobium sp. T2.26MG-19.2B]